MYEIHALKPQHFIHTLINISLLHTQVKTHAISSAMNIP